MFLFADKLYYILFMSVLRIYDEYLSANLPLVGAISFYFLDLIFGKKLSSINHHESKKDIVWFILQHRILPKILYSFTRMFVPVIVLNTFWENYLEGSSLRNIDFGYFTFFLIFICRDVIYYINHRLFHTIPFLWRFHSLHHSSRDMTSLSAIRAHPAEDLLHDVAIAIPLALITTSPTIILFFSVFETLFPYWVHSRLYLAKSSRYNFLVTPLIHHWHHALDCHYPKGQNFGIYTTIWDKLFGSFYCEEQPPSTYGVQNKNYPEGFLGKLLYPFIR